MDKRSGLYLGSLAVLIVLGAVAWTLLTPEPRPTPEEVGLQVLPLGGELTSPAAELSGLEWWGDTLVLLPQYPERFGNSVFALERDAVERALDGDETPLDARRVPFDAPTFDAAEYDGYEAIAIDGDAVYMALEVRRDEDRGPCGRLLRGRVVGALERIVIEREPSADLEAQNQLANMAYEALVLPEGEVIGLHETNGEVNPNPHALVFDRALSPRPSRSMAPIEYRITDATSLDAQGRFWVSNYHWPGAPWQPGTCDITQRYGQGASHARCRTVERLVELQLTESGIRPTERAPIQLELIDDEHARNWEGVVRLGVRGFLLVTDEHPSTQLAFVAAR